MPYTIKKYNGTPLVTIPDRTLDTTASSIKLPGRNYPSYGEPVVDDLIWMLENFAGANPPSSPVVGQLWYDAANSLIKVWSGSEWVGTGKTLVSTSAPSVSVSGQFWYDPTRKQVFVSDTTLSGTWKLVGPIGAANGNDGLPTIPAYTAIDSAVIYDNNGNPHAVMRIIVAGSLLVIISGGTDSFIPTPTITGFATIYPGVNLVTTSPPARFNGNANTASLAADSTLFGGFPTSTFMRNDQSNIPSADSTLNLGSVSRRYSNVYAVNFQGQATSALYADLAERYESNELLLPGTVVCLGGEKEIFASKEKGCTDVFGVISTNPGIKMNVDAGNNDTHPFVAFSGRVPVKVIGTIKKGQRLMTSSIIGVAQVWDEQNILAIIGRALHDKSTEDIENVEVVVGTK